MRDASRPRRSRRRRRGGGSPPRPGPGCRRRGGARSASSRIRPTRSGPRSRSVGRRGCAAGVPGSPAGPGGDQRRRRPWAPARRRPPARPRSRPRAISRARPGSSGSGTWVARSSRAFAFAQARGPPPSASTTPIGRRSMKRGFHMAAHVASGVGRGQVVARRPDGRDRLERERPRRRPGSPSAWPARSSRSRRRGGAARRRRSGCR